jgi:hypothetical protein
MTSVKAKVARALLPVDRAAAIALRVSFLAIPDGIISKTNTGYGLFGFSSFEYAS